MPSNLDQLHKHEHGQYRPVYAFSGLPVSLSGSSEGYGPLPLTATPSGLRGFLFSRRAVPSRHAPAQATGGGQPNKGCTEGALLCPSNAKSEARLLDGLKTATIYNRRGLVAPLLYAAQLVSRDIQTNKGHDLVI